MIDLITLGEFLIDFTMLENGNFAMNPGGAPANVAVAASRLGLRTAFIGTVGDDFFGHSLLSVLKENQISVEGLTVSKNANTTLAFVHIAPDGDRSFTFYRNPGADLLISVETIPFNLIDEAKIFHFGSVSMTHDPARTATIGAAKYAKEKGKIVSFDPNLRPALWDNLDEAKREILAALPLADILKVSEEEAEFLTGLHDIELAARNLYDAMCNKNCIVLVTLGAKGSFYYTAEHSAFFTAPQVTAVDTTGAGDAFVGAFLYQLFSNGRELTSLTPEVLNEMMKFANTAASISVCRQGAIHAMPTLQEVVKSY